MTRELDAIIEKQEGAPMNDAHDRYRGSRGNHRSILIVGEGIAGAALASWLGEAGLVPTIVERAPRFEPRGHIVSLKGNGVEMLRRLGVYEDARARAADVHTLRLCAARGRTLRQAPSEAAAAAMGSFLMISRGELHAALHARARLTTEVRHGTWVTALTQDPAGVDVRFSDGREARYDLVVGADGVRSHTRALAFGAGLESPFGADYLALAIPGRHGLQLDEVRGYMGRGRSVALIPRGPERLAVTVYHPSSDPIPRGGPLEVRAWLLDRYAGFAEELRERLAAIGEDTWCFCDGVAMVRLPSPVRGRVVLVGDAGMCPTFMSGMGASLALQGAYLLARELVREPDLGAALRGYADAIAPIAARYQDGALRIRGPLLDDRPLHAWLRDLAVRVVPLRVWQRRAARFYDAERALPAMPPLAPTRAPARPASHGR